MSNPSALYLNKLRREKMARQRSPMKPELPHTSSRARGGGAGTASVTKTARGSGRVGECRDAERADKVSGDRGTHHFE